MLQSSSLTVVKFARFNSARLLLLQLICSKTEVKDDDTFTKEMLETLKAYTGVLDVRGLGIVNLKGIEYFTGVVIFYLISALLLRIKQSLCKQRAVTNLPLNKKLSN